MPRPMLGVGPERARRIAVLRVVGVVLAVALGAVAVWLIVTSSSQKHLELGVLAGLWSGLIGFASFARQQVAPEPAVATMPAFNPEASQPGGGVLDVRAPSQLQRKEEIAMRREFQARLEKVLRREVQEGLARELSSLRAEVAALRGELLEKVGGQLRLERIETTRLIGSDIEALHQEVRELKFLQGAEEGETETETVTTVRRSIEATARMQRAVAADVPREPVREPVAEVVEAEPVREPEPIAEPIHETERIPEPEPPAAIVIPEPEPEPVPDPEPPAVIVVPEPVPEPKPVAEVVAPEPVTEPEPVGAAAPARTAAADADPFASMPRLTPFTDFEPIADPAPAAASVPGRHEATPSRHAGGRRYREDDSEDNVLARILQREGTRSN